MEVNKVGAFSDNTSNLSTNYDFNKDGTVDIADYRLAMIQLNDDDPETVINYTKDELDTAFADLIKADDEENPTSEITEENVEEKAEEVVSKANTLVDPSTAKTFEELQTMGATLNAYIKECSELVPVLSSMITTMQKELEELAEEKETKESEYAAISENVNAKSDELSTKMENVAARSTTLQANMQSNANTVIAKCVEDYKNGEYPDQDLYSVITSQLCSTQDTAAISSLRNEIDACGDLGVEIKSLCSDIETLVADIRSVEQKYNNKNTSMNALVNTRNSVLTSATTANTEYQKGYARRLELRKEVVDKYYVKGNNADDTSNPQINSITTFLDNNGFDGLPFADAYAIMQELFGECGISFNNGNISMPNYIYWESESEITSSQKDAMAIFNRLASAIQEKYGSDAATNSSASGGTTDTCGYQDADETCCLGSCTGSSCCDPMTFSKDNTTYHFIQDRDNDGVFDDENEFLGAQDGWKEMQAYDADGNGIIEGKELEELKMVGVDDATGQFSFMSAADAGINSIDLSSYNDLHEKEADGDILQGTFEVKMNDGSVIKANQTDDNMNNIQNRYGAMFGSEITDLSESYEQNPFMESMEESVNIASERKNVDAGVATGNKAKQDVDHTKTSIDRQAVSNAYEGENEKRRTDKVAEEEQKKEEAKQAEENKKNKE